MPDARPSRSMKLATVTLIAAIAGGCGGGGGGGGSSSTINGNVSNASTSSLQPSSRRWLARVRDELLGFVTRAFAANGALDGITVQGSSADGSVATATTDTAGDFRLGGAPTGNVTVRFSRGRCDGGVVLPDVTADAVLTLQDVAFDCSGAHPSKVAEVFPAVVRNVPSSPNGNLNVCVTSGGGSRTRVVKIKNAALEDASGNPANFSSVVVGERIEASGEREGLGTSSALDAKTVKLLGEAGGNPCAGQSTPTPLATGTPTPTVPPTP